AASPSSCPRPGWAAGSGWSPTAAAAPSAPCSPRSSAGTWPAGRASRRPASRSATWRCGPTAGTAPAGATSGWRWTGSQPVAGAPRRAAPGRGRLPPPGAALRGAGSGRALRSRLMDLAAFQQLMADTCGARDRARGLAATVAWLAEELGELAQAVRKGDRADQVHELGDVLAWLASLANQLG